MCRCCAYVRVKVSPSTHQQGEVWPGADGRRHFGGRGHKEGGGVRSPTEVSRRMTGIRALLCAGGVCAESVAVYELREGVPAGYTPAALCLALLSEYRWPSGKQRGVPLGEGCWGIAGPSTQMG